MILAKFPLGCFFVLGALSFVACSDDSGDGADSPTTGGAGGATGGKGGSGGTTGGKGGSGGTMGGTGGSGGTTGGSGGKGGTTGGSAGTDGGEGGDDGTTGGTGGTTGGSGGSGGSTGGAGGSGGSAGTGSPELDMLCEDWIAIHDDKTEELGCTSNDSAPIGRMCAISGSCMSELGTHVECEENATTWSCDTGDGHAQTNGACETTQEAYFACLQVAVHEEDPFGCAAAAEMKNEVADTLGCNPDTALEGVCNQLYLRALCVEEWEALLDCASDTTADDYECDGDNNVMSKDTTCPDERAAYDACLPN